MNSFFTKDNAFNVIFFLTIVILAIFKNKDTIATVSPILSCLIFTLSILSFVITALEKIIYNYNEREKYFLGKDEYYNIFRLYYLPNMFNCAIDCKYNNALEELKQFFYPDPYCREEFLNAFVSCNSRKIIRKIRKTFLVFHYFNVLLIFSVLILSEELKPLLENLQVCDFTIWSLVIIILQILLGDSIVNSIFSLIDRLQENKITIINNECVIKVGKQTKAQERNLERLKEEHNQIFIDLWKLIDDSYDKTEQALILSMLKAENDRILIDLSFFEGEKIENEVYFEIYDKTESYINLSLESKFKNLLLYSIKNFKKISSVSIEELETIDYSGLIVGE